MWCTGSLEMQDPKNRHLGTIAQLCLAISSQLSHISTIKKSLLSSNISSTSRRNNYGELLAAEIVSLVWGTPANFNCFRVLASLLQQRHSAEAKQTLHNVWPLPGLVDYIYIFVGCCSVTEFCQVQNSLCSGHEPDFVTLSTGGHLYSGGQPSRCPHSSFKNRMQIFRIFNASISDFLCNICRWVSVLLY